MSYIPLKENLPGITGLLDYRLDTALPIRQLTQILLRGESTLTEGERELIAAVTSEGNGCRFCTAAHTAAADLYLGDPTIAAAAKKDIQAAPLSSKIKALLVIARACQKNGKLVTKEMVAAARREGATDREIHDTVLITALFSLYNRYVDGLNTLTPEDPAFYDRLAHILQDKGYLPSPDRYKDL
ncbi:MAG TPA: peroxidase-related enzyme [Puia sp.]|nr:peroxidase-related enzyme [Puia sp.]